MNVNRLEFKRLGLWHLIIRKLIVSLISPASNKTNKGRFLLYKICLKRNSPVMHGNAIDKADIVVNKK